MKQPKGDLDEKEKIVITPGGTAYIFTEGKDYQRDGIYEEQSEASGVSITSSELRRCPWLEQATEPWWTTLLRKALRGWQDQHRQGLPVPQGLPQP